VLFGKDRHVSQIFSIGSGHELGALYAQSTDINPDGESDNAVALDCNGTANELSARLCDVDAYLRLDVTMEKEIPTERDWSGFEDIETHTNTFLQTQVVSDTLVQSLKLATLSGRDTLGQIGECGLVKTAINIDMLI